MEIEGHHSREGSLECARWLTSMLGKFVVGIFLELFFAAETQLTSRPEDLCLNQQSS